MPRSHPNPPPSGWSGKLYPTRGASGTNLIPPHGAERLGGPIAGRWALDCCWLARKCPDSQRPERGPRDRAAGAWEGSSEARGPP